ncbi:thiamine pyrophosphate-binding protein [Telmatocola sphagniphila]|uniref:Thiamine pyrophosphate-binding protein n=1 Tax=Telmatocola sphagniphila TaxID=1123043 RepID=A0A8E6B8Z0_9BACT|nr:thiamine pyrophosphate-binding protein [Telmatocola sphagniphila]QVL33614.1 thiamine pyrophosphate-binding protein [Telmatocola sphagniphila]
MEFQFSRRGLFEGMAALGTVAILAPQAEAIDGPLVKHRREKGIVKGHMTGAQAVVETLIVEGTDCVYGIPGAQENELWDVLKAKKLPYLLCTHEYSAACMADGYARSTGKPGVICIVPGPGVTNSLTGLGEALLDSVPIVAIVGDVARGEKGKPFQVHCLDQTALLKPVTKGVFSVSEVIQIPEAIRNAFALATCGEPGPTAVVIPYNLLIEAGMMNSPARADVGVPFDEAAFQKALCILRNKNLRVGIYAGLGCMDYSAQLVQVAELLQAPVATSISGKGCIPETHPLAVGWGYGPQGTYTAEHVFNTKLLHPHAGVDCILAIGVKYSEVSTGFYQNPAGKHHIHVDINPENLGRIHTPDVCVNADAGIFFDELLKQADAVCRPKETQIISRISAARVQEVKNRSESYARCGVDPMQVVLALRKALCEDALVFVDVTASEHLAAEAFTTCKPRTYFNPTDNQAMGWSIPAALGAQKAHPGRMVVTLTGDGCFLMTGLEISTAAREGLPVKFFILDDQAYHYMQMLQKPAYNRTTATHLAKLDYTALAQGLGVAYQEINSAANLESGIRGALNYAGPVLVRIVTDYGDRKIRWIESVRAKYTKELTPLQKSRFAARLGIRTVGLNKVND